MVSQKSRRRPNTVLRGAIGALMAAVLIALFLPSAADAQEFRIIRLINGMNRPDLPCCTTFSIFYTPVISGKHVAFLSRNGPPDGIWSINVKTRALKKLVGLKTKAPGGAGEFTEFYGGVDTAPRRLTIGGDTVAFFAADGAGVLGLYTVPVTGGPVSKIVTTNTVAPDGARFTELADASLNGSTIVFSGITSEHPSGVYRAPRSGGRLRTVIDSDDRLDARSPSGPAEDYFSAFGRPVVGSEDNIAFYASGLFDPVSGANAIFRAPDFINVADNRTRLEDRPDNSHVRIGGLSAALGSAALAFRADQPNNGFAGMFKVRSKSAAASFATTRTRAPGTDRRFSNFYGFGYDDTGLAFTAAHPTRDGSEQSVYFSAGPGEPIVKVASGRRYFFPIVGDRSISEGRIVFMEGSNFADAVFVAVPVEP